MWHASTFNSKSRIFCSTCSETSNFRYLVCYFLIFNFRTQQWPRPTTSSTSREGHGAAVAAAAPLGRASSASGPSFESVLHPAPQLLIVHVYEEFMFSPPETSQRLGGDVFGFSAAWDCPCSPCVLSFDRRVANVCVKLCVELPGRGAEAHAVQPKRTLAVSISRSLGQPAPFFLNSG